MTNTAAATPVSSITQSSLEATAPTTPVLPVDPFAESTAKKKTSFAPKEI